MNLPQLFADRMGKLVGPDFPNELGLAVSGGGDSMAMLHLAAGWARVYGIRLRAATVDHGLRPESGAEAALVADECRGLRMSHSVLRWQGWDGRGNLMGAARRARLDLIGAWRGDCRHVLFAHTEDDQAETVLMRFARGAGVEGVSAMADRRRVGEWEVLRPLLGVTRADLRHYLTVLRIPFAEDPTNDDPAYDRTRMRRALDLLAAEGIGRRELAATARRLGRARRALERQAAEAASALLRPDVLAPGTVILDRDGFAALAEDTQLRILAGALRHVASAEYRPREAPLEEALDRWLSGGTAVLHGGMMLARGDRLYVLREPKALEGVVARTGPETVWDRRWVLCGSAIEGLEVRALGESRLQALRLPEVRPPRPVLATLPSVWSGGHLVACAALGHGPPHDVTLRPPGGPFPACLISH